MCESLAVNLTSVSYIVVPSPYLLASPKLISEKIKATKDFKLHETDTGSAEVQIALLSAEIKTLLLHLKKHPKDVHSKRGLLKMVAKRRKFLNNLKEENTRKYNSVVKKIGLKR